MAPDLNSVPHSPRVPSSGSLPPTSAHNQSTPASRRASQIFPMSPPPLPLASPGGTLPGGMQNAAGSSHAHGLPPPLSPHTAEGSVDNMVPMRHPRPMTAAELHLELEKEQEAVVNRLTRELSALRAHTASVASTASSSTSAVPGLLDASDPSLIGPTHPTASRRHRSSSSVSRTSYSTGIPLTASTANIPHTHHRYSIGSQAGGQEGQQLGVVGSGQMSRTPSMGLSTPRYEEVAHYRSELEEAKKENESLRRRIRELERELRGRREGSRENVRGRTGREENSVAEVAGNGGGNTTTES